MAQQLFKFIQMSLMKIIGKFMQHNFQMRYLRLGFFNFNFSRTVTASLALFPPKIAETDYRNIVVSPQFWLGNVQI